jgi:beta-N-acetylhexosaminidase
MSTDQTPPGPVILDLLGTELTSEESRLLQDPAVGGVILFARNIDTLSGLQALLAQIRQIRPGLILAVDQEGGRVQRVQSGVTALPALAMLGEHYEQDAQTALQMAFDWGWLMAAEMLAVGFDISFAPVLDLDYGRSQIIGNRAFDKDPETVTLLAQSYIRGMNEAGMAATGKHFPGHGWVVADSHLALPVDERPRALLEASDLIPFCRLASQLGGIMPAHVVYPDIDNEPAGFSSIWLQTVLRKRLEFKGVIFSDDLSMAGAAGAGDYPARARKAMTAGCDMVLVCNQPQGACEVVEALRGSPLSGTVNPALLSGRARFALAELPQQPIWQRAVRSIESIW